MNSVAFTLSKLSDLIDLAKIAETEFERAAVFGATSVLIAFLETEAEEKAPHALENIERLRSSIYAIAGYELTNGHDVERHLSWAHAALIALRKSMAE